MRHTSGAIFALAATLGFTAGPAPAASTPSVSTAPWRAHGAVTELAFRPGSFPAHLKIERPQTTADLITPHRLSAATRELAFAFRSPSPWSLEISAPNGRMDHFTGGALRHLGSLRLTWDGGHLDLVDFEVRPTPDGRSLDIFSKDGLHVFHADYLHWDLDTDAGRLRIFNGDLRISEGLAAKMGDPIFAGVAIGLLSIDLAVDVPTAFDTSTRGSCPANWAGDVDVQLVDMGSVGQWDRAGGEVVVSPSATLKNVGTADVPWHSKFSGTFSPYSNDQHPFLVWAMYREDADGAFRQLGRSDAKHAFLTLNFSCTGCSSDAHILGLGCEDVYGEGTNNSTGSLGPWDEISPSTGVWAHCNEPTANTPSHFDTNGDCVQDHFGGGEDAFDHGMVIQESDLTVAGATYWMWAWYVVRDDVDIFNTMGWRRVAPSLSSFWSFPLQTSLANGSALDAWVDPVTPPAGTANQVVDLGKDGHLQLAVKTQNLGGGVYRYIYALQNHDFDRRVDSFQIALPAGASVSATSFADIDADGANDWNIVVTPGSVTWQAQAAADAMDWGTTFSFVVEVNAAPVSSQALVHPVVSGTPSIIAISTLGPAPSGLLFSDDFENGTLSAWSSTS
jgi:hypothetical protein